MDSIEEIKDLLETITFLLFINCIVGVVSLMSTYY
jgi:hypothetical protein